MHQVEQWSPIKIYPVTNRKENEKMLQGKIFWIMTDVLLIVISSLIIVQGLILPYGMFVIAGCVSLSVYVIYYRFKLKTNYSP